jgi:hypothetical protein
MIGTVFVVHTSLVRVRLGGVCVLVRSIMVLYDAVVFARMGVTTAYPLKRAVIYGIKGWYSLGGVSCRHKQVF